MRRIFLFMNVSLDGYFEGPSHDISVFHNDFEAFSADQSQEVDALLFGRKTYEMMKFWSTPQAEEAAPEIAKFGSNSLCVSLMQEGPGRRVPDRGESGRVWRRHIPV